MEPNIDHLSITVKNIKRAEDFYDKFLPIVGFDINLKNHDAVPEHYYEVVEYYSKSLTFCLVNPRKEYLADEVSRRRPGAVHHIAFRVPSKSYVDEAFIQVQALGTQIIHSPQYWLEYCDSYYAFFIKDSEGIELEVVNYIR